MHGRDAVRRPQSMLLGALVVLLALPLGAMPSPARAAGPADTSTTISISPTDPEFGDTIDITATVATVPGGAAVSDGVVWFNIAPTEASLWGALGPVDSTWGPIFLDGGEAATQLTLDTASVDFLGEESDGLYLSARYLPLFGQDDFSDQYGASLSDPFFVDLPGSDPVPIATTTTVTGPASAVVGTPTTLTATVTPSAAAGTMEFVVNGSPVGAPVMVVGGVASVPYTFSSAGGSTVDAAFIPADSDAFEGSEAAHHTVAVTNPAPPGPTGTSTTLADPGSVRVGTPVTFAASVSPLSAAGAVQFSVDGAPVGSPVSVTAGAASFTHTFEVGGAHTVGAAFTPANPAQFTASSAAPRSVSALMATSTLVSIPEPARIGAPTTLTATVSPAEAAGTVQFSVDGSPVGAAVPVASGQATLSHTFATASDHTVGATFTPADPATYLGSTGSGLVRVGAAATSVEVSAPERVVAGTQATLTARVTPADVPGQVAFLVDDKRVGTVRVTDGIATAQYRFLWGRPTRVVAVWTPSDGAYQSSMSEARIVDVQPTQTATEFINWFSVSLSPVSAIFECGGARPPARAELPSFYSLLFTIFSPLMELLASLFDSMRVTFQATLCGGGGRARAQTVEGTVDCLLTEEGYQCPFDLPAVSRLTLNAAVPVPAELAGQDVELGSSLALVDPMTGELTPVASDEETVRVPRRTVVGARLSPVPAKLTHAPHSDAVSYRLRVRNAGVVAADRVQACVKVGKGASVLVARGADVRDRRACWTLPRLAKGASITRKLTFVTPTFGRVLTVTGIVTPRRSQADPVRLDVRLPLT